MNQTILTKIEFKDKYDLAPDKTIFNQKVLSFHIYSLINMLLVLIRSPHVSLQGEIRKLLIGICFLAGAMN